MRNWLECTLRNPCPICGHAGWCCALSNGLMVICRRVDTGEGKARVDKNGQDYWVYNLGYESATHTEQPTEPEFEVPELRERANDEDLNTVYSELLKLIPLTTEHRVALERRGLENSDIERGGYGSLPLESRDLIATSLLSSYAEGLLLKVPGFYKKSEAAVVRLAGSPGLVIPVRNRKGLIVALKVRRDSDAGILGKYLYISSSHRGGPGPGSPVHFPPSNYANIESVRLTEGELKANVATALGSMVCLGLNGPFIPDSVLDVLEEWNFPSVHLAFDADAVRNIHVAKSLLKSIEKLREHYKRGKTSDQKVRLESWKEADGKGIDDLLAARRKPKIHYGAEAVREARTIVESAERERDLKLASPLLHDPAALHKAIKTVQRLGVAGEDKNIGLIHLALRSRAFNRPINLEINSPSSAGKSHTTTTTLSIEHPSAYFELTGSSERYLAYWDESLKHRFVFLQEPEGLAQGVGAAIIKVLAWEGRLRYATVERHEGRLQGRLIEKDGPTGLIVCTTKILDEQLSNRMIRLEADTSDDQTRRIMKIIANSVNGARPAVDHRPWQAFSNVLGETADVEVVFSHWLAERISPGLLRIRRDFRQLLTFIQACALEHRYQRTMKNGRIVATVADYAMVRSLADDIFKFLQSEGVTEEDRRAVQAVEELATSGEPVTQSKLREKLNVNKSTASYRVNRLLEKGFLINLEEREHHPKKLRVGEPLPDESAGLPEACKLSEHLVYEGFESLVIPWVDPLTGEGHDCWVHLEHPNASGLVKTASNYSNP